MAPRALPIPAHVQLLRVRCCNCLFWTSVESPERIFRVGLEPRPRALPSHVPNVRSNAVPGLLRWLHQHQWYVCRGRVDCNLLPDVCFIRMTVLGGGRCAVATPMPL